MRLRELRESRPKITQPTREHAPKIQFGQWLQVQITRFGISQAQVCEDIGFQKAELNKYIKGKVWPRPRSRWLLCEYFRCSEEVTRYWMSWE